MSQARLLDFARWVLGVDEERFRELVRELARKALLVYKYYDRRVRLSHAKIALGSIESVRRREHRIPAEVPLCRERYGDGRGTIYVVATRGYLGLGYQCEAGALSGVVKVGYIPPEGETTTLPVWLYDLYRLLYEELGIGARPILDLARKAEEEGDKDVAGALRKIYAILEVSKDIIEEIEKADYSRVWVDVDEREVEKKVEEAVKLLREAKRAAREGDAKRFYDLVVNNVLVLTPRHGITLIGIADYLKTGGGDKVREILGYISSQEELGRMLKEADIYDVFITVAEHFGLEVEQ